MCIELGLIRRVYPTDKQTNILILLIYIDNNNNYFLFPTNSSEEGKQKSNIGICKY